MKVIINYQEKNSPIVLDDILFATRALMINGFRYIDGYEVISSEYNILTLEPEIDNNF